MRVALVHSFYASREPSGENEAVRAHVAALARAGHAVRLVARETDDESRRTGHPVRAALTVATGRGATPAREIEAFDPDVVHVHNLFPNWSEKWVRDTTRPLVSTMHNYRPFCAAGTFLREGRTCTDCVTAGPLAGLSHGCYRGSRLATLPLTLGQLRGHPLLGVSAAVIVLSDLQRRHFLAAGARPETLHVVPNFLPDELDLGVGEGSDTWAYVGRLDEAKGADRLFQWPRHIPLRIVGQGPLHDRLREWARGSAVRVLGQATRAEVQDLLRDSVGLVFTSRWPDPFGLVYMEAIAAGTPVLTVPGTAVADFVEREETGAVEAEFGAGLLEELGDRFRSMRATARAAYESRYTETAHIAALHTIYDRVVRG